ncbi:Caldesmon [Balamuthia mandrillaris]
MLQHLHGSGSGTIRTDVENWLNTKLEGPWSSEKISSSLTAPVLESIRARFELLDTPIKLRVLFSFATLSKRAQQELQPEIDKLIERGERDEDEWVQVISQMFASLYQVQDTNVTTALSSIQNEHFQQIYSHFQQAIKQHDRKNGEKTAEEDDTTRKARFSPLEYMYLNPSILPTNLVVSEEGSHSHFTLKTKLEEPSLPSAPKRQQTPLDSGPQVAPQSPTLASTPEKVKPPTLSKSTSSGLLQRGGAHNARKRMAPFSAAHSSLSRSFEGGIGRGFEQKKKLRVLDIKEVQDLNKQEQEQNTRKKRSTEQEVAKERRKKERSEAAEQKRLEKEEKRKQRLEKQAMQKQLKEEQKEAKKKARLEKQAAKAKKAPISFSKPTVPMQESKVSMETGGAATLGTGAGTPAPELGSNAITVGQREEQQHRPQGGAEPIQPLSTSIPSALGGPLSPSLPPSGMGGVEGSGASGRSLPSQMTPAELLAAKTTPGGSIQASSLLSQVLLPQNTLSFAPSPSAQQQRQHLSSSPSSTGAIPSSHTSAAAATKLSTAPPAGGTPSGAAAATTNTSNLPTNLFDQANSLTPENKQVLLAFLSGQVLQQQQHSAAALQANPIKQILLNEEEKQDNGTPYLEQIIFEINYQTGSWRKLRRKKILVNPTSSATK